MSCSVIEVFISSKPFANTISNQLVDDTTELFTDAFFDALNAAKTQFIEKQSANINTAKPEKFWNTFEKTLTRAVKTQWET